MRASSLTRVASARRAQHPLQHPHVLDLLAAQDVNRDVAVIVDGGDGRHGDIDIVPAVQRTGFAEGVVDDWRGEGLGDAVVADAEPLQDACRLCCRRHSARIRAEDAACSGR